MKTVELNEKQWALLLVMSENTLSDWRLKNLSSEGRYSDMVKTMELLLTIVRGQL